MKKILFTFLVLTHSLFLYSQEYIYNWHQQLQGVKITKTTTDLYGNLYHVGNFLGNPDLEPGPNSNTYSSNGQNDFFVQKTDHLGNLIWVKTFGGTGQDFAEGIVVDHLGYVYVTGSFSDIVDFDPSNNFYQRTSNGGTDIFILKLNSSGDLTWIKTVGGADYDEGNAIDIDPLNNVYITGAFKDTVYFDQANSSNQLVASNYKPYVLKLTSGGNFVWVKAFDCNSFAYGERIVVDHNNNIISIGKHQGTIDLDPNTGTNNFSSKGWYDIYVSKLDQNGNYIWGNGIGSNGNEFPYDLEIDINNNVYIQGGFNGTIDFDPSANTYNLSNSVLNQVFIQKTNENGSWDWTRSIDGCTPKRMGIEDDKIVFTGLFSGTVDFDFGTGTDIITSNGGDDIYCTKIDTNGNYYQSYTMGNSSSDEVYSINAVTDSSFILYGFFQSSSVEGNPYGHSIPIQFSNGGSYFFAKYQICYPTNATITTSSCQSFSSPSGNYTWTSSGTYTDTIINNKGCDSIITLNLTINTVDTTVTLIGATLSSNATGVSYQWVDCDNGNAPISGATSQNFSPNANGNYAVLLNDGVCSKMSACINLTSVGIDNLRKDSSIEVYPNPTKGLLFIESDYELLYDVRVIDCLGRQVYTKEVNQQKELLNLHNLLPGVYLIKIQTLNGTQLSRKFVKQ